MPDPNDPQNNPADAPDPEDKAEKDKAAKDKADKDNSDSNGKGNAADGYGGSPGPDVDRYSWHRVLIGDFFLPPDPTMGSITLKCKSAQKIDAKKGKGKDKQKTTQNGIESTKGSLELEFTAQSWSDHGPAPGIERVLSYIDPNGKKGGGPFDFAHPETDRRGCKSIMVTSVEQVDWKGHHGSCKIDWEEWNPPNDPKKTGGGSGTDGDNSTPVDGSKWTAHGGQGPPGGGHSLGEAKNNSPPNAKP